LFVIPTDILHGLFWSAFPRIYYSVNFGSFPRIFGKYINISFLGNFEPTSTQYLIVVNQQILKYLKICAYFIPAKILRTQKFAKQALSTTVKEIIHDINSPLILSHTDIE
jgi:hypothetical protein